MQVMPLAFIFRIRANHEYPMLVCLLLAVIGIEAVRRSSRWMWITPLALCAAVLVKAAFVAVPLVAVGFWILINPMLTPGGLTRPIATLSLRLLAIVAMSAAYETTYVSVTGESFWGGYWARQMAPLAIGVQPDDQPGVGHHVGFYLLRLLWHPAPWSLALLAAAWTTRHRWRRTWQSLPPSHRQGLLFAFAFVTTNVMMLALASRFAERDVFSANYVLGATGIVVALHGWPAVRTAVRQLDSRVPALPAVCWTILILLRLAIGPLLPRISS
jgi:hypothetical protein